tara:strand:- start:417 stop:1142 length:726 start_codon:yes stop_codon:yes gene_type:complete
MPEDIDEAIDSLTDEFYSGRISLERLDQSRERRKKQIDLITMNNEFEKQESNTKFSSEISKFSQSIVRRSIFVSEHTIQKVDVNDINLIQVDNLNQLSNKYNPALALPEEKGFKNLIIHPLGISPWQKNNKRLLELEKIDNGKILIQLFVRGKPFVGLDYHNDKWIEAIKKLEIDDRLSGVIVYGCPYLFDKIKKSIHYSIPLAYSPSQEDEAQNQILSRIFNSKIFHNKMDTKSSQEFTD